VQAPESVQAPALFVTTAGVKQKGAGLVVAGTHSGSGKTTVACAVMAALKKRGYVVQPFKVGPDYLDPGYHALATGRASINLDLWLMPPAAVRASFASRATEAEVSVVEGMMGLYDGLGVDGVAVSTADVARLLDLPALLVVDAGAMAESAAAVVHGFAAYGRVDVAGVVFNRVAGPRHFELLKRAVEGGRGNVRVLGWLPADANLEIPERQLGLVSADARRAEEIFPHLVSLFEKSVDVEALAALARAPRRAPSLRPGRAVKHKARIAVARDAAFHFYYEDNLAALRAAGAELVPFSPIEDKALPAGVGGLYLGGGFPENHAARLEENRTMRESIREAIARGLPTYAECGGLMYLATNLVGTGVRAWEMVGVLPGEVRMERGLRHFGYVSASVERATFLVEKGETLRGHEFHYSSWSAAGGDASVYRVRRPSRNEERREGHGADRLHASYVHLHFASAPAVARRCVAAASAFAKTSARAARRRR